MFQNSKKWAAKFQTITPSKIPKPAKRNIRIPRKLPGSAKYKEIRAPSPWEMTHCQSSVLPQKVPGEKFIPRCTFARPAPTLFLHPGMDSNGPVFVFYIWVWFFVILKSPKNCIIKDRKICSLLQTTILKIKTDQCMDWKTLLHLRDDVGL